MPIARMFDAPLTMICNNGALVRTPDGETHLRHLLPKDTARNVLQITQTWREGAGVVFDRPAPTRSSSKSSTLTTRSVPATTPAIANSSPLPSRWKAA